MSYVVNNHLNIIYVLSNKAVGPGKKSKINKRRAIFIPDSKVFKALRLFFLPNFPGPTFIPCPTSIPEARVL